MDFQNVVILSVIGVAAGVLSGLLGLGGAIIIIPAMIMLLGYNQQSAQGTTLLMMVLPVGGMAAYQYYKNGFVDVKAAMVMAVFFFVGGYFGAKWAGVIPQVVLRKSFAILIVLMAVKMWFQK